MSYECKTYQGKLGPLVTMTFDIFSNYDSLITSPPASSKLNASLPSQST